MQKKSSTKVAEDVVSSQMQIRKRNGSLEPVDLNKIVRAVGRCCNGLTCVDPIRVASKTISGIFNGASTQELDELSIQTAADLIMEEPEYSKLAANLMTEYIRKEVVNQEIHSFSQAMTVGHELGLINGRLIEFVKANSRKLNNAINDENSNLFEYFGIRTVYDRYLLRHPVTRKVIETPQYFFMRVAAALSTTAAEAIEFYKLISTLQYMPSTPTLFNAGTAHEQMSSCYLMAPPEDSIEGIYELYGEIAFNSKFAGGIGSPWGTVRSAGSLIKGTNGKSNGIVPWLKTLDSSVAAVNQGGRRKGAAAVYLPIWHADIEDALELRDNTGDQSRRTYNLNLAFWVPDVFMERVEQDGDWHLFDPKDVVVLNDTFGPEFAGAYYGLENNSKVKKKTVKARDLYGKMMKTLAETGNGWMCWSDTSNLKSNQTGNGEVIHSSNLCTEILEVTRRKDSETETAVCNLGSFVLSRYWDKTKRAFDFKRLNKDVKVAVRHLDRVIDLNYYPIVSAEVSNKRWRPIGLGVMGLQDVFFLAGLPFDSDEAVKLSTDISEEIYFAALTASNELALAKEPFPAFDETRTAKGVLQFDLWNVKRDSPRWKELKANIANSGLRNSLLIAIAPTATIGSITGVYECIEPQVSNLLKRETLSGEFIQINRYLVEDLKRLGLWTEEIRNQIKLAEGSIQGIAAIPEELRKLYRTAWELSQKSLIDLAAARGPFIDQSQSLNLFIESPNVGKLSSMYMYAWKSGLKTTYYLRSRPATKINKTTVTTSVLPPSARNAGDPELAKLIAGAVACSLENPEACEACQ